MARPFPLHIRPYLIGGCSADFICLEVEGISRKQQVRDAEPLWNVHDVAERLSVSARSVFNYVAKGLPTARLPSGSLRFRREEVEQWIQARPGTEMAARWRTLRRLLLGSDALAAFGRAKPATLFHWALGALPFITVEGQRVRWDEAEAVLLGEAKDGGEERDENKGAK